MTTYFIRYITIFLALSRITLGTEYCRICQKRSHTLCRYKEGPSDNCLEYKKPEFSTSLRRYIVDIHNDIRNHIASGQETRGALGRQPAASNMNNLQWDSELAEIAQRWADQCVGLHEEIQHDQCRKTDRFEVGQNVLTALTSNLDAPDMAILILNWYKQVENVLPSDIENFSGIQRGKFLIGQYTQLVWAETRFVGCGMSTFRSKNISATKAKYLHRLVCNYGPRGNLIGFSVYNRGVPCSKCLYGRCDAVRTSLCENAENSLIAAKTHKNYLEKILPTPVDTPLTTLNLGYILKHNLTEVVNNILKKVKVSLHAAEKENNEHESGIQSSPNLNQIIAQLVPLVMQQLIQNSTGKFLKNALKSTSNMLYHDGYYNNRIFNKEIYDLENGDVIVDDCRQHIYQCQFEGDEFSTKVPPTEDIVLPNNMVYRNVKGVWFHGRCRCNYVYRSNAIVIKYLEITGHLFICFILNMINRYLS